MTYPSFTRRQIIPFFFCILVCIFANGQDTIEINELHQSVSLAGKISWTSDSGRIRSITGLPTTADKLAEVGMSNNLPIHWTSFTIINQAGFDQEYFLQIPKTGIITAWIKNAGDSLWQVQKSGSLLPLHERPLQSNTNGIILQLPGNTPMQVVLKLESVFSIYQQPQIDLKLQSLGTFERQDSNRLLWQGIFLGVILVMALYNLIIFFAVKDISYFYFVLSLIGIGLYFSFYYGIGIEYLWKNAPVWDTFSYTVIVPFTGLMRILFTKTYLHTSRLLPRINSILNLLAGVCSLFIAIGLITYYFQIDILRPMVSSIGIAGTLVLIMMIISGLAAYYREGYEPAKYFIVANVLLVIGGVVFIVRELHFIPDNLFTRYFVQVGTLVQVIMFALGLASRLNSTRLQLAKEIVEKERLAKQKEIEKKELIESQKEELQQQVAKQTIDLKSKNLRLEDIILQLKDSELKLTNLNELKDKLFSIISHDLRNPLATMQSTLKLITQHHSKLSEDEKKKLSHEAQASLDNLNLLLYNLLQWSRSQMNLLDFKTEKIALNRVLENCVRVMRLNAHIKRIQMHVSCPDNLFIEADKEMMEFVFRNLLSNAIKFSHRESDVYIKASEHADGIKIQVLDSGIGITSSKIETLLLSKATDSQRGTEKEKGTGLGLLISKDFIKKNGGQLHIKSQPGKGSAFIVLLPNSSRNILKETLLTSD